MSDKLKTAESHNAKMTGKAIPLTRGMVALVDIEDYDRLVQFKWRAKEGDGRWYAVRSCARHCGKRPIERMHRTIPSTKELRATGFS